MAMLTTENTNLELRRDEKGRFKLFFDGRHVPGAIDIDVSQSGRDLPEVRVTFAGIAVRIVEHTPVVGDV